ncbi:G-protein-signaling modulator 2-like isoform X2 [Denticeps clupeoides]|uniref:G-protein-signaling modulator 2-like isoform X2 n=1 Tax=Denticeps clupeoides TaxID=299321 RepID=UPI0010A494C8|nr:G-protein-signaling modulator 2-like isoform X2 [Denticeps clupeoides]
METGLGVQDEEQPLDVRYRMEASCLELALEGERLCKAGDYGAGVSFFESAIQVGTEDLQILSAIYSQLGNAYFHLHEYGKALEFHHHDLTLTRTIGDDSGEAKASGNLGNTLKVLGRYDEAAVCCQRHLELSRAHNDKVGQARALYNYGNVYHAKGKSICWSGMDPGEFPEEARTALQKATEYYEANLTIVKDLGDRAAQGRTYGNLGNTHYLLGSYQNALAAHEQRLLIAKEFGDRAAERRAYCNLGNANVFLGQFEIAADHYKRTLQLSRLLKDRAVEAQACYSLGNTYTLLQDYERAIDYHLKHLRIAQDLHDRIGEGRACWSLGNAYTALGNHKQAMHFAQKHLEISTEIGDRSGELTARMNVSDLQLVLGLSHKNSISVTTNTRPNSPQCTHPNSSEKMDEDGDQSPQEDRPITGRRPSMENMELLSPEKSTDQSEDKDPESMSPKPSNLGKVSSKLFFINRLRSKKHKHSRSPSRDLQQSSNSAAPPSSDTLRSKSFPDTLGDDGFFDLLSRFQGNRMDDQRCSIGDGLSRVSTHSSPSSTPPVAMKKSTSAPGASDVPPQHGPFLDLLASSQARRLNDQRASVGSLPGLSQAVLSRLIATSDGSEPEEDFFNMLIKCQGSRLDDQRSPPPPPPSRGPTVPDEDFFSLVLRSQAKRMDEQRVVVPSSPPTTQH